MARIHTHYDNLKVARNAPPEVIRAAYKTLSQKYHPDRNPNSPNAKRIIQIINTAYEVLSDPVKRREHDEWITRAESEEQQPAAPRMASSTQQPRHQEVRPVVRRKSHRRSARRRSPLKTAMQKLRTLLDGFSRYFCRKT